MSRILIVEDNQLVAADLSETVISLGYEVAAVAESADRATHLAQELQPDLALMDITLEGDRDGIGAAEEIRSRWRIPVVFLTAHSDVKTVARTTASGAFGHLTKPVRAEELQAAISIALSQHRAARELLREKTWLNTLLSSIHEGVIAADERGCVIFLNAEGERVTGWTVAE
ncbi:MAG: response regulator, partial [Terriglobia bacterium]